MEKVIDLEDRIPTFRKKRRKRTNIKFIFISAIFLIVLFVILYFQSSFSKVKDIKITGAHIVDKTYYTDVSPVNEGDSMWSIDVAAIESSLQSLDWVKSATVKRKWLTTVTVDIEEWKKVAYFSKDHTFYPLLENGTLLEESEQLSPIDAPVFLAFEDEKLLKRLLKELAKLNPEVLAMISQISANPTDVDPYAITLFMNDGYEVRADLTSLAEKLNFYPSIVARIESEEQFEKGIIDIEVGSYYRSYSKEYTIDNVEVETEQEVIEDEEESSN